MIRTLREEDLDGAVSIWYLASIQAHSFISEEYWLSQKTNMRNLYLPNCESWVYEVDGRVLGFISYHEGEIPAIFVDPESQSQGVGTKLLTHLQKRYSKLTLNVYAENEKTHQFYIRHGFYGACNSVCQHTGHEQFEMCWNKV